MAVIDCQAHHISYEEIESMYLVESESSPFSYRAHGELLARILNPKGPVPFRYSQIRIWFVCFQSYCHSSLGWKSRIHLLNEWFQEVWLLLANLRYRSHWIDE